MDGCPLFGIGNEGSNKVHTAWDAPLCKQLSRLPARMSIVDFRPAKARCAILPSTCADEDSARKAKLPEMGLIG